MRRNCLPAAAQVFADPSNEILLSVVSVWELSVTHSLGKLPLPASLDRFVLEQREQHGITVLPLEERAVFHLHKLPALHRDPFDRMLIAQAGLESLPVVTADPVFAAYRVPTIWDAV